MNSSALRLPERGAKPRERGLTLLIDPGLPRRYFQDAIESASLYIDLVKFGWGTSIVSDHLEDKIACLQDHEIEFFFGGTLFEKFYQQHKVGAYYDYCRRYNCSYIEISNGTVDLANEDKARIIADFAGEFKIVSEVGYKDSDQSQLLAPSVWIAYIRQDLAAGATKVLLEARESGTSGICRPDGTLRYGLIEDVLNSGIDSNDLIFEAPTKALQTTFIHRLGPQVNLANIPVTDAIGLETLRLGLRADTLLFVP
ncbi:MAG: phosphosulfolactate synthase [Chloroflexi bacterium]|nr:MAG: phosphosulfolactate synthase [Chloroflexota bacterium]